MSMKQGRILIVEDDEDILELIRYNLSSEGYQPVCTTSGEEGLEAAMAQVFDLVILDLMLPGIGGLDVCRKLRNTERTRQLPIIIVTAKSEEADTVAGLELGADDYVTKPFSPRVLLARIHAVLRRKEMSTTSGSARIVFPDLVIDPDRHEVQVEGEPQDVSVTEFKILHVLAQHPGRVFTRGQIIDAVHGQAHAITDRAVDVQIVGLRKRLKGASRHIDTVRAVGYRFKE